MPKTTIALAAALFSATLLTGCASSTDSGSKLISFPGAYKIDIQQGNVITREMVDQLRPGMTRAQVQYVMGTPLIEDTFNSNRWDYIYSLQPGGKSREQKTVTLFFVNDQLHSIQGDLVPGSNQQ
ncbi:outer membrane protein assembly factor BamE [Endozoicomonas acroporae]|uniref:outer membrane protein assembly factor BamE n=1 Tax=Endozoicomonas TaxID=305899 RepID=UPI000C7901A9|nr:MULTISPECIES: outer membrane protein assembly factor BamE [Endozoicomonas]WBA80749.1 outer membrane protein assembly factor BamE [Endozoicomonas sp. GU-1]WBA88315.1 outer membrane protein assembly factor BamE [Endozoicomonas sp. GU-1]